MQRCGRLARSFATSSSLPSPLSIRQLLASRIAAASDAEEVTVKGWIRTVRKGKHVSFAVLNDGSDTKGLQAVLPSDLVGGISVGSAVELRGALQATDKVEQGCELQVKSASLVGASDASVYPIRRGKEELPVTFLRRHAHLRPRQARTMAMLRLRSEMAFAVHSFFRDRGFMQVQTPLITTSDCEGGGSVFAVTPAAPTPPPPSPLNNAPPPASQQQQRYLTVSSQLHLEAIAASHGRVYTLSPAFRAEDSDTARHLQEFWMLEVEESFLPEQQRGTKEGLSRVMDTAEQVVRHVVRHAREHCAEELELFAKAEPELLHLLEGLENTPFVRMSYTEAIELLLSQTQTAFSIPVKWGAPLASEHEKWLALHAGASKTGGGVFITDYPADQKPWYMLPSSPSPSQGPTVACFDLLLPSIAELAGGSLRQHELSPLLSALQERGMDPTTVDWYLDLRRFGTTPHGGFGIGWERLVMLLTGEKNVRECTAFPRAGEGSRF